ncbi:Hypothetical predicted protein [Marmota monax]|uniref:Protein phosphatase 1 regulatory subunit 14 n=1 Tax=Marmota monax TaxID=9995 RepID=A0A5E4C8Z2_MARMO|nr:Hypothetical predicted protein [Marmota monax]
MRDNRRAHLGQVSTWVVLATRAQGDAKGKSLSGKPPSSCKAPQPGGVDLGTVPKPYHCQEEKTPELEIGVKQLLDMESNDTQAARVKELMVVGCYKPTDAFIPALLDKMQGMQKLSSPQEE